MRESLFVLASTKPPEKNRTNAKNRVVVMMEMRCRVGMHTLLLNIIKGRLTETDVETCYKVTRAGVCIPFLSAATKKSEQRISNVASKDKRYLQFVRKEVNISEREAH
jgi:hypothetical protein